MMTPTMKTTDQTVIENFRPIRSAMGATVRAPINVPIESCQISVGSIVSLHGETNQSDDQPRPHVTKCVCMTVCLKLAKTLEKVVHSKKARDLACNHRCELRVHPRGSAQRFVPVSYPKMKPPIDTRTPMARDRTLRNWTGDSSYTPVSFSGSGDTCMPSFVLPSGEPAVSLRPDDEKSPMLLDLMVSIGHRKG